MPPTFASMTSTHLLEIAQDVIVCRGGEPEPENADAISVVAADDAISLGGENPTAKAKMDYRIKRMKAQDGQTGKNGGRLRTHASMSPQQPLPNLQPHDPKADAQCNRCSLEPFKDVAALRRHVATAHTRPFFCAFAFAGCTSRFGSKNEWKRHIASQHLGLHYYRCSSCPQSTTDGKGNTFNRKDLFTQHLRRMHATFPIHKTTQKHGIKVKTKWGDYVKNMQKRCCIVRRLPPQQLVCPKTNCSWRFKGHSAWNEWTEHVGRHMENGEGGSLGMDSLLVSWALDEKIILPTEDEGYRLYNPMTSSSGDGDGGMDQTALKHSPLKTRGPLSLKKTTPVMAHEHSLSVAATNLMAKVESSVTPPLPRLHSTRAQVSQGVPTVSFFSLSGPTDSLNESLVLPPLKNSGPVVPTFRCIPTLEPDSQLRSSTWLRAGLVPRPTNVVF